jgi:Sulfocyanin (SoxE) domain
MHIADRSPALLFAGLILAPLSGGCSSGDNRPRGDDRLDEGVAVASTVSTPPMSDSPPRDTARADSQARPSTPPRPSIDPGRKGSKTRVEPPAQLSPAAAPAQDQYLKYDAATNTVTFDLIGGPSGFAFNGYTSGGATLVLPSKANVVMPFINKDGTPHSAQIISGEGPLPNAAVDAAIPRAYTNQLLQGLPQEGTDTMRFAVPEQGTYRIFCGVPGHGLSGMWIWMRVDPKAKAPSFGPTKK